MKKLLFFLLLPLIIYFLFWLQNGVDVLFFIPTFLYSLGQSTEISALMIVVIFIVSCLISATWSARIGLIPQLTMAYLLSMGLAIPSLDHSVPQIMVSLITQPVMLMGLLFPAVCLGTVACMVILQPIAVISNRDSPLRAVLIHRQGKAILTLAACFFMSASLQTVAEYFQVRFVPPLPAYVSSFLEANKTVFIPGNNSISQLLANFPIHHRLIAFAVCTVTVCLWMFVSVKKCLRGEAAPRRDGRRGQHALRNLLPITAAARQQAILNEMDYNVRNGRVAGLNLRTGFPQMR